MYANLLNHPYFKRKMEQRNQPGSASNLLRFLHDFDNHTTMNYEIPSKKKLTTRFDAIFSCYEYLIE